MAWYRVGTVNVTNNSSAVVGIGTAWVQAAAIGETFLGPDGGLYEITGINSNTSLLINPAYKGPTSTAQNYAIMPTQSYLRDLAAEAAALVASYAAVRDGAGQGKFAAGTEALPSLRGAADENTGVRFAGSDVLQLITNGASRLQLAADGTPTGVTADKLRDRSTHTGTQTLASISDAGTAAALNVTTSPSDTTPGRLLKVGDFGVGADAASGQIRSWVLPYFSFGDENINDEYLLLFPSDSSEPHSINGSIKSSRGSSGTGNLITNEKLVAQSAFGTNILNFLPLTSQSRFLYFSKVSYDGVVYIALRGALSNGSAHNQLVFYGTVIGGDANLFRRVRSSEITVITEIYKAATPIINSENAVNPIAYGGIIERGSNANGEYVKFADGTLICTHQITCTYSSDSDFRGVWTFPVFFSKNAQVSFQQTEFGTNIYTPRSIISYGQSFGVVGALVLTHSGTVLVSDTTILNAIAVGTWI